MVNPVVDLADGVKAVDNFLRERSMHRRPTLDCSLGS